jgi:hypothetical protein
MHNRAEDLADTRGGTIAENIEEAYTNHPSRLKSVDPALCMGRRIKIGDPLTGTRKGDPGANGRVFPEAQCSKKPTEGKLCARCAKLDVVAKATPDKNVHGWYGRLDEALYWKADVVGCANFFTKYPNGIPSDRTTAPSQVPADPAPAPAPAPDPATTTDPSPVTAKKPRKVKKKAEEESVAVDTVVKTCEWVKFVHNGLQLVRNLSNGNVYRANTDLATPGEMADRDKFEGRWLDSDLDEYAEEVDE